MEFTFEDSVWVSESDLEEMIRLHRQHNMALEDAFAEVSDYWDDCYFYIRDNIEKDVVAELERRIKESEK